MDQPPELENSASIDRDVSIGVLFGCFGRQLDGPGFPGGLIIYQHLLPQGRLWAKSCEVEELCFDVYYANLAREPTAALAALEVAMDLDEA